MPNWCENTLTIEGPKDELQKFLKFIGKGEEIAKKFIPYPKEFKKQDKVASDYQEMLSKLDKNSRKLACAIHDSPRDSYNMGGYNWCCVNWGVKWDFDFEDIDSGKDYIQVIFNTAWSPPTPVIHAISKRFPKLLLELQYREEGMCFEGTYEAQGGEVLNDFSDTIKEKGEEDENKKEEL